MCRFAILCAKLLNDTWHISLSKTHNDSRKVRIVSHNAVWRLHQKITCADFLTIRSIEISSAERVLLERSSNIDPLIPILEGLERRAEIRALDEIITIFAAISGLEESR